jgi:hypothetical protein
VKGLVKHQRGGHPGGSPPADGAAEEQFEDERDVDHPVQVGK